MTPVLRPLVAVVGAAAAAFLIVGCAAGPAGEVPTSSPDPIAGDGEAQSDLRGALLDEGRLFAVVSWGSSSCVPVVDEVVVDEAAADGQSVSVTLVEPDDEGVEQACTADLRPRASIGAVPTGVDPTRDITLKVTYGEIVEDVVLAGDPALNGTPGEPTDYQNSAGWFEDGGLVLLTWGSSTCAPIVESLEGAGTAGTVVFAEQTDRVCTMDMVPRATILVFEEGAFDADAVEKGEPFALTLVGGELDGTVEVR